MQEEPAPIVPPTYPNSSLQSANQPPPTKKSRWLYLLYIVLAVLLGLCAYAAYHNKHQAVKPGLMLSQPATTNAKSTSTTSKNTPITIATVSLTANGFVPATIAIKTGQAIVWTNTDNRSHLLTVSSSPDNNLKVNQTLNPSDSYSYVFNLAGTYVFNDCSSHGACASNNVQVH